MSESLSSSKIRREKILAVSAGGVCIAVAFVLSLITIFKMPMGGSVTPASMLPIFFFALCFGPAWGFGAAFIFSLLQLIGGDFLVPVQVLLDYTIAFTLLGTAGFFAAPREKRIGFDNILVRLAIIPSYKIILGVLLGLSLRMLCHVISGAVFYAEYAGDQNPWVFSIVYNGTFFLPEAVITVVCLLAVMVTTRVFRSNKQSRSEA
jgi:thiamine transporter